MTETLKGHIMACTRFSSQVANSCQHELLKSPLALLDERSHFDAHNMSAVEVHFQRLDWFPSPAPPHPILLKLWSVQVLNPSGFSESGGTHASQPTSDRIIQFNANINSSLVT